MDARPTEIHWSLGVWWTLATAVGYTVGWAASLPIGWTIGGLVGGAIVGGIVGGVVGVSQWAILRGFVPGSAWWVAASIVGYAGGLVLGNVVGVAVSSTTDDAALLALGVGPGTVGAVAGGAQWLVIRRGLPIAWLWIAATVVGVTGGGFGGDLLRALSLPLDDVFGFMAGFAVFGAIYGVVTGATLVWILRRSVTSETRSARRRERRRAGRTA